MALEDFFTMCHTDFSVMPSPRVLPALLTRRNNFPRSIAAAFNHSCNSHFTSQGRELCAHVRPCPLNRLWPNDLLAAGDDPMSKSRLHAFSSRRRGAEPTVRGHACLLTSACQVLARVFGLVLRLASYRGAHECLYPFDAADSSCQIGTEQT